MSRLSRPSLCVFGLAALLTAGTAWARTEPAAPAPRAVVVGMNRDYPPYEFLDASGAPAGYNVDLTRAIAEVTGMTVRFRSGNWAEIRSALMAGEIDILQGISASPERDRQLDFAQPHAIVHHAIFARADTPPVDSLEALRGKKVIVFAGGILDDTLTARGFGEDLIRAPTPKEALRLLAAGRGDYVALALLPGTYLSRELGLNTVSPVANNVAAASYGYAVKAGNTELLARFEEGMTILKKTGRYKDIRARWLGVLEPPGISREFVIRFLTFLVLPLVLVLGGTVLWSRSLKKLVTERTQSLAREVVERKRSEEQLRLHQQQLVQADKMAALGVLASGIAHEINNPNGFILLNLPTLKAAFHDASEVLDAHQREVDPHFKLAGIPYARMREELPRMLDEVLAGGKRIKRIVEDLKDFARREDAPRLEPTDLNVVARAAVRLVEARIQKATRRFGLELGDELPRVRGNPQRIEQVIVNLLLNACEALPGSDQAVLLRTREEPGRGTVVLEVEDEGVGIRPENLLRLTEPFFTTKRESGGTGLGLSVSAGIVKEHGGKLEFVSRPGQGTVARLTLPALPQAELWETLA